MKARWGFCAVDEVWSGLKLVVRRELRPSRGELRPGDGEVTYLYSADDIEPDRLRGFFVGWPNPPSPLTHLALLQRSDEVVLAVDAATGSVVGFITAVTDGVLTAHIPLLEVLPSHQRRGIGTELVRRMLERLADSYAVDLLCDPERRSFYERQGMRPAVGMMLRNHARQSGR